MGYPSEDSPRLERYLKCNKMTLSEDIKNRIKEHALAERPKECCGIIFENLGEWGVHQCPNHSEKPTGHFSIPALHYVHASSKGEIKAIYHSHNSENENFSENDKANSHNHKVTFLLYNTFKNSFFSYDPKRERTTQLNRKFTIGKSDCYTVIKDHYLKLGITLEGENSLGDEWHKKNPHLIQELFNLNENNPSLPIEELDKKTPLKRHDVVVFEFKKGMGPNHVGVYLGNGTLHHHPRNKYPVIEKLQEHYLRKIYKIYRHKDLNEKS